MMKISYLRLDDSLKLDSFDCGNTKSHKILNKFLKERAMQHQKEMIGTTIIALDSETDIIAGYITLLADIIKVEENQKKTFFEKISMKNKYDTYPSIKIGRLAVHKDYQKLGIGNAFCKLAIAIAVKSNKQIGIRFIVANAKKIAKDWYVKKQNFRVLDENDELFLYYDLRGWSK
ncbi:MAG: GNAT family N-acetyltransferase [Candidatus Aenigmarchaeota archaeon]|nr:GNAT family N-acetyltransferase [Candidatus Aenigmarchaeota archaeon]